MIKIITSNNFKYTNLDSTETKFVMVYLQRMLQFPVESIQYKFVFKIYYQESMNIDKTDYINSDNYEYEYIPVKNIREVLQKIIQENKSDKTQSQNEILHNQTNTADASEADDVDDDTIVLSCYNQNFNSMITKYLKNNLDKNCLDIFRYMKTTSITKLENIVKTHLQVDGVFSADPIQFAYSISCVLNGVNFV